LVFDQRTDAVLISGWQIRGYRAVLRELGRRRIPRILCMDNQWRGTPKQWLGRASRGLYIQPFFDTAFVPGDRQARFARVLGFREQHLMRGLYCADTAAFAVPADWKGQREPAFLFTGRLSAEKGIDVLADGYRRYRSSVDAPWPLRVAGIGPHSRALAEVDGVDMLGFLQPADLPKAMWSATAAVSPGIFEPWGVAIHEATAAGLPVICSEEAGAGVHLVQDGYNGYVVPTGNGVQLAKAMRTLSLLPPDRLKEMASASVSLSLQFSAKRWAQYVTGMLEWDDEQPR
jgi:glycosyltransferase involved in cell wall biosynthesis